MPTKSFHTVFPNGKALLPVIHVGDNRGQALANARIVVGEGADGMWLINHRIRTEGLLAIYREIREEYPTFWIGLNFLDRTPAGAIGELPEGADGLWIDNAGIDDYDEDHPTLKAQVLRDFRQEHYAKDALLFGGIDFKYQKPAKNPNEAARLAMPYLDVVTTSGSGTGSAPTIPKIQGMHEALGGFPLAIASGTTVGNIAKFLPFVDAFLVATSINYPEGDDIDPRRLAHLVSIMRMWS